MLGFLCEKKCEENVHGVCAIWTHATQTKHRHIISYRIPTIIHVARHLQDL